ncbi:unnamed protein product, partial [Ectocarpus sp. 12 AP-2014]
ESKFADGVELDATTHQIGPILGTILEKHRDYFCVGDGGTRRKAKVYCIESCEWSVSYLDLLKSLPLRWSSTRLPDDTVVFSRDDEGAEVKVTLEKPDLGGRGSLKSIRFNGIDMHDDESLRSARGHICNMQDLEVALSKIDAVQACLGISQQHVADDGDLPEGTADVFPSVVRAAERALGDDDGYAPPKRWEHARLRGLTAGTAGVSGVLSFVDGRDVFWSKHCAGVASGNQGAAGRVVPRCS